MFCARIPRHLDDGLIRLRPLRIFDGPFLYNGLREKHVSAANGLRKPLSSSWLSVWWWIKRTFVLAYFIECDSRRIGFIGLHNLRLGESAEISLAIFDSTLRHHGYGTRAFRLLAQRLQRGSIIERILAQVRADNHSALSFCNRLGFREIGNLDGVVNMSMDLNSRT
jgi:RimJ/RimL family protein N-acetyltransferase